MTGLEIIQAHHADLEQYMWDHVEWTFKVKPSAHNKEGRIIAEWRGGRLERIFNTRDATKMSMFEWIQHNQASMIADILIRLENQYGSTVQPAPKTDSSPPRLPD